jgi:formylmethanofuran dehydrogenase subunit C
MSMRAPAGPSIEVDGLTADRLALLGENEIANLPVWIDGRAARVGDVFAVRGERSARVRVEGDMRNVDGLASGSAGGEMVIDGSVGRRVGAAMTGGWVDVRGNAGDEAGLALAGGSLRIVGNAGHRAGAAAAGASKGMTGGEIVIDGSAGDDVGARVRRGLVVVTGDVGTQAARAIIAGTVLVFGRTGAHPARGNKRGSVIALGGVDVPPTYRYACAFHPAHVRLTLIYLRRRYGLTIDDEALNGRYRRYCGDAGNVGKGEILELVKANM